MSLYVYLHVIVNFDFISVYSLSFIFLLRLPLQDRKRKYFAQVEVKTSTKERVPSKSFQKMPVYHNNLV